MSVHSRRDRLSWVVAVIAWMAVIAVEPSAAGAKTDPVSHGTLQIRVSRLDKAGPMVGVNVVVLDHQTRIRLAEALTDDNGDVHLTFLAVKKIEIRVEIPNCPFDAGPWIMKRREYLRSDWHSFAVDLSLLSQIDRGPNKTGKFRIFGTVLFEGATPAPGVTIAVFRAKPRFGPDPFGEIERTVTGPDGRYDVTIDVGNPVYVEAVEGFNTREWFSLKGLVSKYAQKNAPGVRRDLELREVERVRHGKADQVCRAKVRQSSR